MDDQARIQQTVKRPVKAVQALAAEWLETCSPFRQSWQELAGGRLQCNLHYKYPLNWYAGIIRLVQADQTSTLVIWELPSYGSYADPADNPKWQMVVDIAEAFDEFLAELQTDQQPGEVPAAVKLPTRLNDRRKWQTVWRIIRGMVDQGTDVDGTDNGSICAHLQTRGIRPNSRETVAKIITAGQAGLLDNL